MVLINAPSSDIFGNNRPNPSGSNLDIGALENNLSKKLTKIYISKEGSDTNSGNSGSPFLTISKGISIASDEIRFDCSRRIY